MNHCRLYPYYEIRITNKAWFMTKVSTKKSMDVTRESYIIILLHYWVVQKFTPNMLTSKIPELLATIVLYNSGMRLLLSLNPNFYQICCRLFTIGFSILSLAYLGHFLSQNNIVIWPHYNSLHISRSWNVCTLKIFIWKFKFKKQEWSYTVWYLTQLYYDT